MSGVRVWFGLILAGCGSERLPPLDECAPPAEPARLSWNHACEHLRTGRAEELDARTVTPEIRNTHIVYRVALAPGDAGYGGKVSFNPRVTSRFVFYTSEAPALNVTERGAPRCRAGEGTSATCELRRAELYDLGESEPVTVELGPTANDTPLFMAEIP